MRAGVTAYPEYQVQVGRDGWTWAALAHLRELSSLANAHREVRAYVRGSGFPYGDCPQQQQLDQVGYALAHSEHGAPDYFSPRA